MKLGAAVHPKLLPLDSTYFQQITIHYLAPRESAIYFLAWGMMRSGHQKRMRRSRRKVSSDALYPSGITSFSGASVSNHDFHCFSLRETCNGAWKYKFRIICWHGPSKPLALLRFKPISGRVDRTYATETGLIPRRVKPKNITIGIYRSLLDDQH